MRWHIPGWMRQAACADEDPNMFFEPRRETEAKKVCRTCPVNADCYRYARTEHIDHGIWGGQNPTERGRQGRPNGIIHHGTWNGYQTHARRGETACDYCRRAAADYQWQRRRQA